MWCNNLIYFLILQILRCIYDNKGIIVKVFMKMNRIIIIQLVLENKVRNYTC